MKGTLREFFDQPFAATRNLRRHWFFESQPEGRRYDRAIFRRAKSLRAFSRLYKQRVRWATFRPRKIDRSNLALPAFRDATIKGWKFGSILWVCSGLWLFSHNSNCSTEWVRNRTFQFWDSGHKFRKKIRTSIFSAMNRFRIPLKLCQEPWNGCRKRDQSPPWSNPSLLKKPLIVIGVARGRGTPKKFLLA